MSWEHSYQLTGNTRQDVKALAKELLWSGIQPTGAKIREVIGNGPSQTTVLAALREFYQEHGEYLRSEDHLPPGVREACEEIAAYVVAKKNR